MKRNRISGIIISIHRQFCWKIILRYLPEFIDPPEKDCFPDPGDPFNIADFFKAVVAVMKLIYLQDRMDEINDLYHKELDHLNRWIERKFERFCRPDETWFNANC